VPRPLQRLTAPSPAGGLHDEGRFNRVCVQETDGDPAVALGENLGRHVAGHEFVAGRQHDGVALDAEPAREDDEFTVTVVRLRVAIRLVDAQTRLAPAGTGARASPGCSCVRVGVCLSGRLASAPVTTFKAGLPGRLVEHRFLARLAAIPDHVEVVAGSGPRGRDFVRDPELRRLRREQFVARVVVALVPFEDGRRRLGGRLQRKRE